MAFSRSTVAFAAYSVTVTIPFAGTAGLNCQLTTWPAATAPCRYHPGMRREHYADLANNRLRHFVAPARPGSIPSTWRT